MYKQIKIIFKDDRNDDYIDPVCDNGINFTNDSISVNNGYSTYIYKLELIKSVLLFEIQEEEDALLLFSS